MSGKGNAKLNETGIFRIFVHFLFANMPIDGAECNRTYIDILISSEFYGSLCLAQVSEDPVGRTINHSTYKKYIFFLKVNTMI